MTKNFIATLIILLLMSPFAWAEMEDFTTYTVVEENPTDITVDSATQITYNLSTGDTSYVYDDKGGPHFNRDFEHLINAYVLSNDNASIFYLATLANYVSEMKWLYDNSKSFLTCIFNRTAGGSGNVLLRESDSGAVYTDFWTGFTTITWYYLKFKRVESVGTFGTIYLYIYSNAARTVLIDTLSVALHTSKKDYQYNYAVQSFDNDLSAAIYGKVANLDLQEVVGEGSAGGFNLPLGTKGAIDHGGGGFNKPLGTKGVIR